MGWTKLQYSKKEVNDAGTYLLKGNSEVSQPENSINVIDNFRGAHAFPLNTLQNFLRGHAKNIDEKSIIAQRLKRLSSIKAKLERFKKMELWDMQDIGGCRAIVHNVSHIEKLVYEFKSSSIRHHLVHEDDYVDLPRDSGYRSRHLVYRYFSDRNDTYNGRKIEIQIRTTMQHAWATAVETVDAFTQQALKSSMGKHDWERFFQLMATEMAFREKTALVPKTPTNRKELLLELRNCADDLQVISKLYGFSLALRVSNDYLAANPTKGQYFLLSLDSSTKSLVITPYRQKSLGQASKDYSDKEKEIRENKLADAVLVSVDSIQNLRRAYPNYFADTKMFMEILRDCIEKSG